MPFRLVPKSLTLNDLELLYVQIFSEFCASWHVWKATTAKRIKIDPYCQPWNCCPLRHWKYFSTIYRLRWYCYAILTGGRFSELHPIYQGCRALTFALAGLSCYSTHLAVAPRSDRRAGDTRCLRHCDVSTNYYCVKTAGRIVRISLFWFALPT